MGSSFEQYSQEELSELGEKQLTLEELKAQLKAAEEELQVVLNDAQQSYRYSDRITKLQDEIRGLRVGIANMEKEEQS